MKVSAALKQGHPTLSFEFFPPKTEGQEAQLYTVIAELKRFAPDFVSVTYGAMGTTRAKTFFWVRRIKHEFALEPVAHLTCVAASRDDIARQLDELEKLGAENILALRGDPPEGMKDFVPPANGFRFAKELIGFIKQKKPAFCIGAAGFPEAPRLDQLKEKVEAGADYIITQLFFDNRCFFDFVAAGKKAGITVPIIPGLMPITSVKQIKRLTQVCGASIPHHLLEKLEKFEADAHVVQQIGVEQTAAQCQELLKAGVAGLHFFVMNQAGPISAVLEQLKLR